MAEAVWSLREDIEKYQRYPNTRPRDAATIMLFDATSPDLRILMGRRHAGHVFMANATVFPGGRVDAGDHLVPVSGALHPLAQTKLMAATRQISAARVRAMAVAALRELAEETGLCIGGAASDTQRKKLAAASASWRPFAETQLVPDISGLTFIARAVTPPRIVRRYDTRFFAADASRVRHRLEGVVGPDSELTELFWVTLDEARALPLSLVTRRAIEDFHARYRLGLDPAAPVPYYHVRGTNMVRELL